MAQYKKLLIIGLLIGIVALTFMTLFQKRIQPNSSKTTEEYILDAFTHKYSRPKEDFKIQILNQTTNAAKGTVNIANEHSGGLWFAVMRSGGWEIVNEGNGIMPCNIANKNNLPSEIVSGCVDTENGDVFVQR